ncbi:rCG62953, partial [Rattus norvegicus]
MCAWMNADGPLASTFYS